MKRIVNLFLIMILAISGYSQVDRLTYDVGVQAAENLISQNFENCGDGSDIYEIPVVFHIIHKGEPIDLTVNYAEVQWKENYALQPSLTANVAREHVLTSLQNLNDRFDNTWIPYWLEGEDREATSLDAGIRFVLAHRDPSGNPTTGIIRHDFSSDANFVEHGLVRESSDLLLPNELAIKQATGWPRENYLNVWVVPEIDNNNGGCGTMTFGTFPSVNLSDLDGIVIQANRFGYGNLPSSFATGLNAFFTEAVGTYLGLYQTWYDTSTPEDANNEVDCNTEGDRCCDTPPTPRNCSSLCSSRAPVVGGGQTQNFYETELDEYPDVHNYMDDTSPQCKRHFTQDQVCRMRATLQNVRTELANQSWITTAVAVNNLGIDISIDRTGINKFKPIVILENSGDFTESQYSIDLQVSNGVETFQYSYDQNDLAAIEASQIFNVSFPEVQIKDEGTWSITAAVSQSPNDAYLGDNTKTYQLDRQADGSISIQSNYKRAFWMFKQFDIYDVNNDEIVMDGRKWWSNSFLTNKKKAAETYAFDGYGDDVYGNVYPFITRYNATGSNDSWEVINTWYLEPGEYVLRFFDGYALTDGPGAGQVSHLIYESCLDGCNFSVLLNGTEVLYSMDETWLDHLANPQNGVTFVGFNGMGSKITSASSDVNLTTQPDTLPYPLMYRFNVPEGFVSNEQCYTGGNNGFCDNASLNDPFELANVNFDFEVSEPGTITTTIEAIDQGTLEAGDVNILLASDENFNNIVKDTTIYLSYVHDEHIYRKAITKTTFDGLQEGERYWAKINTLGYPNAAIDTVSAANNCVDVNGNPITFITVDGIDHDVVSIGNQCWFAENLKTSVYSDGTPIMRIDSTDMPTYAEVFRDTDSLFAAYIDPRLANNISSAYNAFVSQEEWDEPNSRDKFGGFFYNYLAYDNPNDPNQKNICPEGFRVASLSDFELLADAAGPSAKKALTLSKSESSELGWGWSYNVYYGDNDFGFNGTYNQELVVGDPDGYGSAPYQIRVAPGRQGWGAVGAWKDIDGRRNWWYPAIQLQSGERAFGFSFPEYEKITYISNGRTIDYYSDGLKYNNFTPTCLNNAPDYCTSSTIQGNWVTSYRQVRCVSGAEAPEVRVGGTTYSLPQQDVVDGSTSLSSTLLCNFDPSANVDDGAILVRDECGVCGGNGIPEGACDCAGQVEDAIGICGGDCASDVNGDGICDVAQQAELLSCLAPTFDGHTYSVEQIGDQCWFTENLRTRIYNNNQSISEIQDNQAWSDATSGAYSKYDNDDSNTNQYGYLYNWYAINTGNLCPVGWKVPTDKDFKNLEDFTGMSRSELNSTGYRGISTLTGDAIGPNGTTGWSGDFGGIRVDGDGQFRQLGNAGYYWTQSAFFSTKPRYSESAWSRAIFADQDLSAIGRYHDLWQTSGGKGHGLSVRCILED
jgi:uncharacterized protein (TIGR02145 family)